MTSIPNTSDENEAVTMLDGEKCGGRHPLRAFLVIIGAVIALDLVLTFVYETYGSYAEVVWSEYYARAGEPLQTVLLGSSFAQFDLDPNVFEEDLGASTFSLATPAQSFENSYSAAERAIADHHPDRIILALAYDTFCQEPWINAAITFTQGKVLGEPLQDAARDVGRLLFDPFFFGKSYSIVSFFPWSINHVALNYGAIALNVRNRVTVPTALEASTLMFPLLPFDDKGRAVDDELFDFDTVGRINADSLNQEPIPQTVETFERICELCEHSGTPLYVVVVPRPTYELIASGESYPEYMAPIQQIARSHGAHFLDFNLAHPSFYRATDQDYKDVDHLNNAAAVAFCDLVSDVIRTVERGSTVDNLFFSYSEWEDCLATFEDVCAVMVDGVAYDDRLEVTATAYTRPGAAVEYEFAIIDPARDERTIIRKYGPDPTCTIPLDGHGSVTVGVHVRAQGSNISYERANSRELLF